MPDSPPGVTPTIDMVCDCVAAKFPSGASLIVSYTGEVELITEDQPPSQDEVYALAEYLIEADDLRRAAAVMRWAA